MKPDAKPTPDAWSPRMWHRRAAKPISIWMFVFILAGLSHIVIPNYRWVLIHIFTLGVLTNSILVWSQHLTEKFVQQRLPDSQRPRQVYRIYAINIGVIITLIGNMLLIPALTITGAAIIAVLMAWHAASLFSQWRSAEGKRFRPIVAAYTASALCLPVGAFFGGWLSLDPGNPRLLLAHIAANIGGFAGLAAAASLNILLPAVWRSKGISRYLRPSLVLLAAGVAATIVGALVGLPEIGLIVYVTGWVLSWQQWLGNVNLAQLSYQSASSITAVTWLVLSLVYYTATLFLEAEPALPTLALLVGFAAQLLLGMMSYLLPTTMGGGPAATRAGLMALNRAGLLRWTLLNGGLLLWLASDHSWRNVALSLLCLGSLAVFPVFMVRSVKRQRAVITKKAPDPGPEPAPDLQQVGIGLALLAIVWFAVGAI
ncbi:copper oxidase [Corynebacterium lizhenjunii]|uniref:copper oxidase n=1 Tax=Corynebacterium lizhenjunii TaxID=2709394 RepID=UPI001F1BD1D1|nr:copper oxidase [Corynebacterium lizhenjunii]